MRSGSGYHFEMPRKFVPKPSTVLLTFRSDKANVNRFVEICDANAIEVPDAMRLILTEAVKRGTFDLWPESTENGNQPSALVAAMLDHGPTLRCSEEKPVRKRRSAG